MATRDFVSGTHVSEHNGSFHTFAGHASLVVGSKWAFTTAVLVILFWGLCGPYFHFSDTWQLVVNTATTIVTILIVFLIQNTLIQNTQNRDARAIHLKLDEIIHALKGARNEMIQIENLSDSDLENISKNFERIRAECERRTSKDRTLVSK
jgi:low affinity Fe/Cu permease